MIKRAHPGTKKTPFCHGGGDIKYKTHRLQKGIRRRKQRGRTTQYQNPSLSPRILRKRRDRMKKENEDTGKQCRRGGVSRKRKKIRGSEVEPTASGRKKTGKKIWNQNYPRLEEWWVDRRRAGGKWEIGGNVPPGRGTEGPVE